MTDAPTVSKIKSMARGEGDYQKGAAYFDLKEKFWTWTTVGSSYPVGTSTSWIQYRSSQKTDMELILSFGGPWVRAGAEKTIGTEFSFKYPARSWDARSYQVGFVWGRYLVTNLITGVRMWRINPMYETGYVKETKLRGGPPNWGHCGPVTQGQWQRSSSSGRRYSLAGAVKFKDFIGFDVGSDHAWDKKTDTVYNIKQSGREMCGKDDVPARASKFMMDW